MSEYPIRMRASVQGDSTLLKVLLKHPMENGFGKERGLPKPAHYITEIEVLVNDAPVARVFTGSGIATDPLFGWRLNGVKRGDKVGIVWKDNQGLQQSFATTAQ